MRHYYSTLYWIISTTNPKKILDVGCGEGILTAKIKARYSDITIEGMDVEQNIINEAGGLFKGIGFSVGSVYELAKKLNTYDMITCLEVLEHLEYPTRAIKEMKRATKKYCVFSVPYEPYWRIANIFRGAYLMQLGNTRGHIQHWNKNEFRKLLKKQFKEVVILRSLLWNFAVCWD